MAKRKAADEAADQTPVKKRAIDSCDNRPLIKSFREGLFEEDAINTQQKEYVASEP